MNKKVMITGVAGLIGSHLAENLLSQGVEVYGFDVHDLDQTNNLKDIKDNIKFHYYKGDIKSEADIADFFQSDATEIYHLASVVGVNLYMEDPLSLIDICVIGTRNLVSLCMKHNVRMLYTSTSEVYGRNTDIPWNEDADRVLGATNVDRWSYSSAKALTEHILFGVHHSTDWPMSIVRFFNVYGPRQNPIFLISKSIHRVLNDVQPELYDGGEQTRCFTYIDDVVEGLIAAANKDSALGQVINLGNPEEISMKEAMNIILEESGSALVPIDVNTSERYGGVYEDIIRRVPDVAKAKELLNWEPSTDLRTGVKKIINWTESNSWYLN
jgi:UDP-glucose 4-epimerase